MMLMEWRDLLKAYLQSSGRITESHVDALSVVDINVMRSHFPMHMRQVWANGVQEPGTLLVNSSFPLRHHSTSPQCAVCTATSLSTQTGQHLPSCDRKETLFVPFPALSDTDCSVFITSINQSMLPLTHLLAHWFSQCCSCSLMYSTAHQIVYACKLLWCLDMLITVLMGWFNYSECQSCTYSQN